MSSRERRGPSKKEVKGLSQKEVTKTKDNLLAELRKIPEFVEALERRKRLQEDAAEGGDNTSFYDKFYFFRKRPKRLTECFEVEDRRVFTGENEDFIQRFRLLRLSEQDIVEKGRLQTHRTSEEIVIDGESSGGFEISFFGHYANDKRLDKKGKDSLPLIRKFIQSLN